MKEYRCILRTFWEQGLRDPGAVVLAEPADMQGNRCFVPVEPDPKQDHRPQSVQTQTKKTPARKASK